MNQTSRIYIAGHRGLAGSAIWRELERAGFKNLVGRTHADLDPLEPTNEWYAVAKIAGIKMCEAYRRQYGCDFISAMPTNLYGLNDNYHPQHSHVLPGLIRRFHEASLANAPTVTCWGTGAPMREF